MDWTLTLQRLELEQSDVPNDPSRVGETVDALTLRTRSGMSGGGAVADVMAPLDSIGHTLPLQLGPDLFGVIGAAPHDRYASTHISIEAGTGIQRQCHVITNPDYAVDFFVCLSSDQPVNLKADISGLDYTVPLEW